MKRILMLILIFLSIKVLAQIDSVHYRLIPKDVYSYVKLNDDVYNQMRSPSMYRKQKAKLIFVNKTPLDSSGLSLASLKYFKDDYLIGNAGSEHLYLIHKSGINQLDIKFNDSLHMASDLDQYYLVSDKLLVYEIDSQTLKPKLLVDLSGHLCNKSPCYGLSDVEAVEYVFSIDSNKFMFQTCITGDNSPSCAYIGYYIYDRTNNQVKNVGDQIKSYTDPSCREDERTYIWLKSADKMFLRAYTNRLSSYCEKSIAKSWLADREMNHKGDLLCLGSMENQYINSPSVSGFNMQDGSVINYYLLCTLDDKKQVLVPYKFIPQLEIDMFKAYNNTPLKGDDLSGLGKYELGILKNLIFAKHNYDFTSAFYKAYFNLYCFYNSTTMRQSRVKNLNNKLTAVDKKNLYLIKALEN